MLNLSISKLSIEFKKLFDKSCKVYQPKKGYGMKSYNYAGLFRQIVPYLPEYSAYKTLFAGILPAYNTLFAGILLTHIV